jgi:putative oxidoreductase
MNTSTQTITHPSDASAAARDTSLAKVAELTGRVFLAALFLLSGIGKLGAYSATAGYMASVGVPRGLLPIVIGLEIGGALALIVGWQTRVVAFLLAGFTIISALIFHTHFADQIQMIMFWKNTSIAGGLLLLVVHGAGPLSLDGRSAQQAH